MKPSKINIKNILRLLLSFFIIFLGCIACFIVSKAFNGASFAVDSFNEVKQSEFFVAFKPSILTIIPSFSLAAIIAFYNAPKLKKLLFLCLYVFIGIGISLYISIPSYNLYVKRWEILQKMAENFTILSYHRNTAVFPDVSATMSINVDPGTNSYEEVSKILSAKIIPTQKELYTYRKSDFYYPTINVFDGGIVSYEMNKMHPFVQISLWN